MKIALVGSGELINRLPETFARPGLEIVVLGPKNCSLRRSSFIDKFVELIAADPIELWEDTVIQKYNVVLEQGADWIIFSDDETIGAVARSTIPFEDKLRLLPARSTSGLNLLGSKVGLGNAMNRLDLPGPKTIVVENPIQLSSAIDSFTDDFVVKGDLLGGGSRVRKFTQETRLKVLNISPDWYPLVAQEFVEGVEVSIEALFRDGRLAAWLYSEMRETMDDFGPSTARRYVTPELKDFEEVLNRLGAEAGLNGMFNVALIWSPARRAHFLFELDPRPNTWHQFGQHFGVDWVEAMLGNHAGTGAAPTTVTPAPGVDEFIRLYPRDVKNSLNTRNWRGLMPWLTNAPGTWSTRNRRDKTINRVETREVLYWFSGPLIAVSAKVWQALPPRAQRLLVKIGVKRAVIFWVGA